MIPVWQAYPYLLVGSGPWDLGAQEFCGVHARYERLGAAGTVFRVVCGRTC